MHTEMGPGTRTKEYQMSSNARPGARILGSLRSADGKGVVRMEDRLDADVADVWSALTDPSRLARWYGEVEGDLRPGGEYRARLHASGWEGTGRIEACEPRQRLLLLTRHVKASDEGVIEVTLAADGHLTILVWEERGMPVDYLAAYGAGIQVHVEDLAAHLAGRERCDAEARFGELLPVYQDLARPASGTPGFLQLFAVRETRKGTTAGFARRACGGGGPGPARCSCRQGPQRSPGSRAARRAVARTMPRR
jgi:uncharacterized protein YndB with AHSA1/START domain